jgi:hypothetical protein
VFAADDVAVLGAELWVPLRAERADLTESAVADHPVRSAAMPPVVEIARVETPVRSDEDRDTRAPDGAQQVTQVLMQRSPRPT